MKRRLSTWIEEDNRSSSSSKGDDDNNNNKRPCQKEQPTPKNSNAIEIGTVSEGEVAGKIQHRRRSERLQLKQHQSSGNKTSGRGKARVHSDVEIVDDANAGDGVKANDIVGAPNGSVYKLKPRCELSIAILNQFENPKLDTKTNKLSAICRICRQPKQFLKGNVSNLKTHLKRVITQYYLWLCTHFICSF